MAALSLFRPDRTETVDASIASTWQSPPHRTRSSGIEPIMSSGELQPGDLLGCWAEDSASWLISLITSYPLGPSRLRWGPSHVAMIAPHPKHDRLWIESTALCARDCVLRGHPVRGFQAHRPADRIRDYVYETHPGPGRVGVWRPSPLDSLDEDQRRILETIFVKHLARQPVGYSFRGAFFAGTHWLKRSSLLPEPTLEAMFCSELCAALLMRLGLLCRSNPISFSPASLLRTVVSAGTYQFAGWAVP